ncbi:hypothetical protein QMK33_09260 [Hymenobacter sp. H14-R3]|uniref:hypothetical protein n=1 Tax=Hymenobacter sp. H14-R3 TaxID=3046308 RepID=UPI0024B8CB37|nr:hypothetical protein [Hymenobacter sp. H14-R3]MDJ0365342.1 hypothetical protein [Hymenobacter sp. H14-R3]
MTPAQARQLITLLASRGVLFAPGLSESELTQLAQTFGVVFPPDLQLFLQTALPVSPKFAHWRYALNAPAGAHELRHRLAGPLEGLLFDVKVNTFWYAGWGAAPADATLREQLVRQQYPQYPALLPVYSHRYLPAHPPLAGNPVLSVWQTDIIYYGNDLASYFANEFGFELPRNFERLAEPKNKIDFWDTLVS